jgi:hypothetical protein
MSNIWQGIVQLVQKNATVQSICGGSSTSGYLDELPKNAAIPNWTYMSVSNVPQYALIAQPGLVFARLQIDCYSYGEGGTASPQPGAVITLGEAIDAVLSGFAGTCPNGVQVDSIFTEDKKDFPYDSASRTYRRMLEYRINYYN